MAKIERIFVLMLENRSFDHLFSLLGLPGVNPPPASTGFKAGAPDRPNNDPPHDFDAVAAQIAGGSMTGFPIHGGPEAMRGFQATGVPVLLKLAKDNLLMDNWYSSMPGPTWPNRYFVHAGSSGGLDNNLGTLGTIGAVTGNYLRFQNGHVFDRMTQKGVSWRIYRGDSFPHVLSLKGMIQKKSSGNVFFRKLSALKADLAAGDAAHYTFIEPDYDNFNQSRDSNSMHPLGSVAAGEKLISYVYNAIFRSGIASKSLLVVTWDEHGGFFDHLKPPTATAPGDQPLNKNRAANPKNFNFKKFGVRVPTLLISPWLPKGLGSQVFGNNAAFDHSSVIRALRTTFNLGPKFTERDAASPDWNLVLRSSPRILELNIPLAAAPRFKAATPAALRKVPTTPISGNLAGTLQIAVDMDNYLSERLGEKPIYTEKYAQPLEKAGRSFASATKRSGASTAQTHRDILRYLAAVEKRDQLHETKTLTRKIRMR